MPIFLVQYRRISLFFWVFLKKDYFFLGGGGGGGGCLEIFVDNFWESLLNWTSFGGSFLNLSTFGAMKMSL